MKLINNLTMVKQDLTVANYRLRKSDNNTFARKSLAKVRDPFMINSQSFLCNVPYQGYTRPSYGGG